MFTHQLVSATKLVNDQLARSKPKNCILYGAYWSFTESWLEAAVCFLALLTRLQPEDSRLLWASIFSEISPASIIWNSAPPLQTKHQMPCLGGKTCKKKPLPCHGPSALSLSSWGSRLHLPLASPSRQHPGKARSIGIGCSMLLLTARVSGLAMSKKPMCLEV